MNRSNTLGLFEPPAAICFIPSTSLAQGPFAHFVATNFASSVSLTEQRIRSAFEHANRELDRYERYPEQWDGYKAQPFSLGVLSNAALILGYSESLFLNAGIVPQLVTTGPASDGSVDVELRVQDRRILVTLYPEDEQVKLTSVDREGVREYVAPLGEQTLESWVSWLHEPSTVSPDVEEDPVHSR